MPHVLRVAFVTAGAIALCAPAARAQNPDSAALDAQVHAWYAAWNSGDPEKAAAIDASGVGYGFRTVGVRAPESPEYLDAVRAFFGRMEHYRITIDELHTSVYGDTGLAWGVHTEEFTVRGRAPERVRVRFTLTFAKTGSGWKQLLFHRDVQPFDERGYYIPDPAVGQ